MQPLFEHRRAFGGYDTRVLELEGDGPPLIFFHGFSDSADTWRLTLDRLGRRDRRAIAVDLPGFAEAGRLRPGAVLPQLDAFAREVLAYAGEPGAAAAVPPPIVVGNSLGGCVALRLGERAGDGLAGVVAVAPAGLDMARWFTLIENDLVLRTLLASPLPVPPPALQAVVGRIYRALVFADPRRVDAKVIAAFARHHRDRATVARFMDTGRRLLPELRDPFRLEEISPPVLLVWGSRDRLVFPSGAQRVIDALPGTRLELIESCGHCPQLEAPERFAALLEELPEPARAAA
jgi:pimeloyl-ACP methyl ester carboxylesterase